jgi:hypothetical protein
MFVLIFVSWIGTVHCCLLFWEDFLVVEGDMAMFTCQLKIARTQRVV